MDVVILSPLDQAFVGRAAYSIDCVCSYPQGLSLPRLQQALDRVLVDFWPLAAELRYQAAEDRFCLHRQGRTIQITERRTREDTKVVCDSVDTLPGCPLVQIALVRGPAQDHLAVSMSHAVGDGFGFFHFLSAWCATLRGESYPKPVHDRAALLGGAQGQEDSINKAFQRQSPESFYDDTGIVWLPHLAREDRPGVHYLREPFVPSIQVADVSDNAALAAQCLRQWVRANPAPAFVHLACALDLRRRCGAIPAYYFGNAAVGISFRWAISEYQRLSDEEVARQIQSKIQRSGANKLDRVIGALRALFVEHGSKIASFLHPADPHGGILVTNLTRFPSSFLDCGVGPPLSFGICSKVCNTVIVTQTQGQLYHERCVPLPRRST